MELRYNLTQQDFKRGLLLHERRPRGALTIIRKVEWFFFLGMALFGAAALLMLLVVLASGRWEEDFGSVLTLSVVTLAASLLFLWLLSAKRRALHGGRLLAGEGGYFGPRVLALTREGVAVTYGVNRRVEPYDALQEVWTKRDYVVLYLKAGVWEVLPPCAFSGPEERAAFLAALAEARQGRPPQTAAGEDAPAGPEGTAAFVLRYAWTPEELRKALLGANQAYLRTRLYWRPAVVVIALLSLPVLLYGVYALADALTARPPAGVGTLAGAVGALLIGAAFCLPWLSFVPGFVGWAIRRQEKKNAFSKLLAGPITDTIGPEGVDSLRPGERERTLWSQIGGVKSAEWGLALFRRDRKMLLFPASAFAGLAHQEQAADYARGQIRQGT